MSEPFNPFAPQKHTREEVSKLFGPKSSAKLAQQTKVLNPKLYDELRQEAQEYGLIGPQAEHWMARSVREAEQRNQGRAYSDAELVAMSKFDKATCDRYLRNNDSGNRDNLQRMSVEQPELYEQFRVAAKAHGFPMSERQEQAPAPRPKPADERFQLSDELCDRSGLPRGTKIVQSQMETVATLIGEKNAAAKTALAEKLAADVAATEGEDKK
jgi:hypothetical protein